MSTSTESSNLQTPIQPDPVIQTYTFQQKQNNYNKLLKQLGDIASTVEKAVQDALKNLKLDTDLQVIKDAINKIDNEEVKNLINSKTNKILQKFSDVQMRKAIPISNSIASEIFVLQ
ncbi:24540_t:CDS:2 [Cetraspora pellucida]|uniref:24540_t:CDS:1 n=1 Tax=Cetraspora pellucida TaxID=1433469 RepID=A0A9N9E0H6_9GLOM|nr:24540_t:CDS:2 [Cetraspora pellucida]